MNHSTDKPDKPDKEECKCLHCYDSGITHCYNMDGDVVSKPCPKCTKQSPVRLVD